MSKIKNILTLCGITLPICHVSSASSEEEKEDKKKEYQTIIDDVKEDEKKTDDLIKNMKNPIELTKLPDILKPLSKIKNIPKEYWEEFDIDNENGQMNHSCGNSGCN